MYNGMGLDDNKVRDIKDGKYGKPHEHESEFEGPIKDRSCTDILCLILWIAFIFVWVCVGIWSFTQGDPRRLIYPSNSKGEICGKGDYG